jgi:hypothetical protein
MALDKEGLKSQIKAAFVEAKSKETNPDQVFDALAGKIADAVDQFVKELQITYTTGLTAPNGPVAGNFTYTLS